MKRKRPWTVYALALAALGFAIFNLTRLGMALSLWQFLSGLPMSVSPAYLAATGLIWGIAGLLCAGWLFWGAAKAPWILRIMTLAYTLFYWIEQFFLMQSPLRKTNWVFSGALTVILVAVVIILLALSGVRAYYGDHHE